MTRRQKDPLRSLTEEERNLLIRISRSHAENPLPTSLGPRLCSPWRKVKATRRRRPKSRGAARGTPSRSWSGASTEKVWLL